ncbi:uncharacterized protein TNCV_4537671 [Trichonephila clavipes]|nr:uncharacterized protein TNCV_4537671 [Trichonephila clavipes]
MSIGKFKKDELRCIPDELKLVVPDNAELLDLRELIQESVIYKNDKETYQAIVDCVLEEINDRRNENENRLEIEKKLNSHISGSVGDEVRDNKIHCGLIRDSDLNTTLKSFRELKSIGVKNENCNSKKDVSSGVFKQRVHFKNDRYEVELPWKRDSVELSDNLNLEKRQLGSPMRKMQSDKGVRLVHVKEEMGSEKSDEDMELPQATERFIPLESERAKMLSVSPDAMAQPVTVPEEKCLPRVLPISVDEMCEEKEEKLVDVMKKTAKEDINPVVLNSEPLNLNNDEIEEINHRKCGLSRI